VGLVNDRGLAARGLSAPQKAPPLDWREYVNRATGVVSKYPAGVDPGFAYNPGKAWLDGKPAQVKPPDVQPVATPAMKLPAVPRQSLAQADAALTKAMQPWADRLSPAEEDALHDYKATLGMKMNLAVRGVQPQADLSHGAKVLEAALDRAVMPQTVRTFRAAGPAEIKKLMAVPIGGTFEAEAFVSASLEEASAAAFSKLFPQRLIIQIIVPKGTRGAAYVHPFPEIQHKQFEVLLNIGTKLRIVRNDDRLVLVAGEEDSDGSK
jgi:hypothetical protein